ncbi:unnamed protein product [Chondrus crispus]|uniref:Uncharacterized protein n=1 Tax=Chondrus crispus TaxID=2769 RepID=R7QGK4_CHOCR|nr:unnamed protein product [Chondrus crispus]CDF36530.1 unnamed protein product [Chondrus crispus]|eukprot:XP_005716349.1 unnamed protein product [Chondrus crispus]
MDRYDASRIEHIYLSEVNMRRKDSGRQAQHLFWISCSPLTFSRPHHTESTTGSPFTFHPEFVRDVRALQNRTVFAELRSM